MWFLGLVLLMMMVVFSGSALAQGALSDEFDDAGTLGAWTAGLSPAEDLIDIDTSRPGHLAWIPTQQHHNAWYEDNIAPIRYKLITGDFLVQTYVIAGRVGDVSAPPTGTFNSAGFLLRNPSSGFGSQNYLMYNLGYQSNGLATEAKTTVDSESVLVLTNAGTNAGQLAVCRVGGAFRMYRWLDDEAEWHETDRYTRTDLPETLQMGLVVNAWTNGNLYAQFDYVRVDQTVRDVDGCFEVLTNPQGTESPLATTLSHSRAEGAELFVLWLGGMLAMMSVALGCIGFKPNAREEAG